MKRDRHPRVKMTWTLAHPSHVMVIATDIRCPGSTPRFYTVHHCTACEMEEMQGVAGKFLNPDLELRCMVTTTEPAVQASIDRLLNEIAVRKIEIRELRKR